MESIHWTSGIFGELFAGLGGCIVAAMWRERERGRDWLGKAGVEHLRARFLFWERSVTSVVRERETRTEGKQ